MSSQILSKSMAKQGSHESQKKGTARDYSDEVRQRLKFLIKDRSQADISRRTRTPGSNVSRYLLGTKIPAEFCAELVTTMGVNPSWLLAGEGAPYVSEIADGTAQTASNLLELVEAMNAVLKMRIGSLSGKEHLKVLRQLSENLETYERLREKLDHRIRPFFEILINDYSQAVQAHELEKAGNIRQAADQISRLCDDKQLKHRFNIALGHHEYHLGNVESALAIQREAFQKKLATSVPTDLNWMLEAFNFCIALLQARRIVEASRVCRASLILAEQTRNESAYYQLLRLDGAISVQLGDLQEGYEKILAACNVLTGGHKKYAEMELLGVQLKQGAISLAQAIGGSQVPPSGPLDPQGRMEANRVLTFAFFTENAGDMRAAYKRYVERRDSSEFFMRSTPVQVRYLLQALSEPKQGLYREFMDEPVVKKELLGKSQGVARMAAHVCSCQLARLAGEKADGLKELEAADKILQACPPEERITLIVQARHYRNALLLISEKTRSKKQRWLRQRAQEFFNEYCRKGFGCFRDMATISPVDMK